MPTGTSPKRSIPRKAKADYQRSNDSVQAFVEECVDIDTHNSVIKQEFYRVYAHWCRTQNEYPVSQTKLKEELKKLVPTLDEARVGQWSLGGDCPE